MTGPTDLDPCSSPSISTAAARLDSRYRLPRPVCYISLPTPTPHAPPRGPGSNHCPPPCRRAYLCLQPSREVMRSHGEGAGFYVCVPSVPSPRPKQHHGVMELMWTFPRRSHQLPTSQKRNVPSAGLELPGPTCRAGVSVVKSGGDPPSCPGPSFPSITVSPSSLLCVPRLSSRQRWPLAHTQAHLLQYSVLGTGQRPEAESKEAGSQVHSCWPGQLSLE